MENKKLHPKYETGKLGLSDDEIKAEKIQIDKAICARSFDEDGKHPDIAYTWFRTPQEDLFFIKSALRIFQSIRPTARPEPLLPAVP